MPTIRAAVCREFGAPLQLEDIQLRAPHQGEVEITLSATAICHSDISFADGIWGGTLPAVYGHEAAGIITAVGEGVHNFTQGDRVIVTLIKSCGGCASCGSGRPVGCSTENRHEAQLQGMDGTAIEQAMNCGAFAERVVVDQSQIVQIPADMKMDVASLLSCGVITGVGAVVNTANVRPGETVVVIGAGGVGLNAIQGAYLAGAARIIAVDRLADKLETAREFGATDTIIAGELDLVAEVSALTKGRMADCVLVSVGAIGAYDQAPELLANGGKMVMVGMPHVGAKASYEPVNIAAMGQAMIGSKMGDVVLQRDIPWLIDLYEQGRLKLDELISRRWKFEEINEAIADTRSGSARRNVVIFDETD